jgi:cell division septation protein DedD
MEEALTDDQSHYEISLTAGQAFVAFVLLLLSLAASFAFGLLIGRGQADEHMIMRKDAPIVTEAPAAAVPAPKKAPAKVASEGFKPTITEGVEAGFSPPVPAKAGTHTEAAYAQLLSTSDQKTAEALAAKLIEGGFTAAYVERTNSDKGTVFRVRVKFPGEGEARAAEGKLKQFSKEVWITK